MPKVSVIIPVYNVEKYLSKCLDSVINQTLKDIEIICIDDGSTDNSLSILEEYAKKDKRIKIIKQKNLGAGAARNKGLEVAKGDYLSFLDSDDFFELDMLEKLYDNAININSDIAICNFKYFCTSTGKYINARNINKFIHKKVFNYEDIPNKIFNIFDNCSWNKLLKTSFVNDNNLKFQEIYRTNDLYFTSASLIVAKKISVISDYLVCYRIGIKNNSQSTNYKFPLDFTMALTSLRDFLISHHVYGCVKKSYFNLVVDTCRHNLHTISHYENEYNIVLEYLLNNGFDKMGLSKHYRNLILFHNRSFLQSIFSIKNSCDKQFKIITLCGLKIKIKRRNKHA